MKLTNIVVKLTIIIPELEVDPELGLRAARHKVTKYVHNQLYTDSPYDEFNIVDCPDYPTLCN